MTLIESETPPAPRRPPWLMPGIIVMAWLFIGFFNTAQQFVQSMFTGVHVELFDAMAYPVQQSLVWAFLTPFLLIAITRVPLRRRNIGALAAFLFMAVLLTAAAKLVIDWLTFPIFTPFRVPETGAALFRRIFFVRFYVSVLTAAIVAGLYLAVTAYDLYRDRELRTRDLAARLAQAQLQMLEMQLNPHFLFNSLQSVAELMHSDVEAADRMIGKLSELLRLSLSRFGVHELALREELDFVRRYLAIEEIRFSDRLTVEIEVDANVLDAAVPSLVLQPLVENALKHGVARRLEHGRVRITARRTDSQLFIEVSDNGPGLTAPRSDGVGLANTRARLEQLFGRDQHFVLQRDPTGGVRVEMTIPLREMPHEA